MSFPVDFLIGLDFRDTYLVFFFILEGDYLIFIYLIITIKISLNYKQSIYLRLISVS